MGIKNLGKRVLEEKENMRYRQELARKRIPYGEWAAETEAREEAAGCGTDADFVLFLAGEGYLASGAAESVGAYFAAHPETQILYGDEDVCGGPDGSGRKSLCSRGKDAQGKSDGVEQASLCSRGKDAQGKSDGVEQASLFSRGKESCGESDGMEQASLRSWGKGTCRRLGRGHGGGRKLPWYKPDWSPELLDSFFYFGSVVAVRRGLLERTSVRPEGFCERVDTAGPGAAVYEVLDFAVYEETVHRLAALAGGYERGARCIGHVEKILFHGESMEGQERFLEASPFLERLAEARLREFRERLAAAQSRNAQPGPFLSIVIPSRDHPEVLERCLRGCLLAAEPSGGAGVAQTESFLPGEEAAEKEIFSPGVETVQTEEFLPGEEAAEEEIFSPGAVAAQSEDSRLGEEAARTEGFLPGSGKALGEETACRSGEALMAGDSSPEKALCVEVIVVDNGSTTENRQRTEEMLRELECAGAAVCRARYLYRPMEFNFSKMCNLGAAEAEGELLLFLNDDVELCQAGTLERMAAMAVWDGVGAVGLKLYYPDSRRIQHAGITNLPMGPVHKLQFQEDDKLYYYGANRGTHNMLAVTAACLMVGRDRYQEVQGFPEELRVAFNDVDFCFSLYEAGYRNVCMNGIYAYHHESLSRGDDESAEKLDRLAGEREKLYKRHPALEGRDPYYAEGLSREGLDTGIRPAYLTERNVTQKAIAPLAVLTLSAELSPAISSLPEPDAAASLNEVQPAITSSLEPNIADVLPAEPDSVLPSAIKPDSANYPRIAKMPWDRRVAGGGYRMDACVLLRVEDCRGRRVLGYGVVLGDNNACYDRTLLLWQDGRAEPDKADSDKTEPNKTQATTKIYALKVEGMYRPDLEENMPDQRNVALCGFDVEIGREAVPAGKYRLGMAVRNRITGLGLLTWSNRFMTV